MPEDPSFAAMTIRVDKASRSLLRRDDALCQGKTKKAARQVPWYKTSNNDSCRAAFFLHFLRVSSSRRRRDLLASAVIKEITAI